MKESGNKQQLVRFPKISSDAEVTRHTTSDGGVEFEYPVIDGASIADWNMREVLNGLNASFDPQLMRAHVEFLEKANDPKGVADALSEIDAGVAKEMNMSFATRLQRSIKNIVGPIPMTQNAIQEDLGHAFIMGRIIMRFLTDKLFEHFDGAEWEKEFLVRKNSKGADTTYTLVDFFAEKAQEIAHAKPMRDLILATEKSDEEPIQTFLENMVLNFSHGLKHVRSIKEHATSDDDLRKKLRQVMHVNALSFLANGLMGMAEDYSYFWKPLRTLLADKINANDFMLSMACDAPLKFGRAPAPTRTCPVHYLPSETFNGLVDLMVKYPEGQIIRRGF